MTAPSVHAFPGPVLTILHFNDVYEITARKQEPAGGASRFASLLSSLRMAATAGPGAETGPCLTLFSGDALNPSLLSTVTRGKHMVGVLNEVRVDVACVGNHDLDWGAPAFSAIAGQCAFPWLLSNVSVKGQSSQQLGNAKEFHVLEVPWPAPATPASPEASAATLKIGFIGVWEWDCIATLATVDPDMVVFEDPIKCGNRLASAVLRNADHPSMAGRACDVVIALTHMRSHNDELFARSVRGIDLLLGGHDHDTYYQMGVVGCDVEEGNAPGLQAKQPQQTSQIGAGSSAVAIGPSGTAAIHDLPSLLMPVIKSGTDFRNVTMLRLSRRSATTSGTDAGTFNALSNALEVHGAPSKLIGHIQPRRQAPAETDDAHAAVGGAAAMPLGPSSTSAAPQSPPGTGYQWHVSAHAYEVTSQLPEHPALSSIVDSYSELLGKKMESTIGLSKVPLDSRFSQIRTRECAIGNFVVDLMRQVTGADIAILNSGTLRADAILGPGILKMKELVSLLPMQDPIVTVSMRGDLVLKVLENAVSQYPKLEGRFAQVSGLRFAFNPRQPPGQRIVRDRVTVHRKHRHHSHTQASLQQHLKVAESSAVSTAVGNVETPSAHSHEATPYVHGIDDCETDSSDDEDDELGPDNGQDSSPRAMAENGHTAQPRQRSVTFRMSCPEPSDGAAASASDNTAPASSGGMRTALLRVQSADGIDDIIAQPAEGEALPSGTGTATRVDEGVGQRAHQSSATPVRRPSAFGRSISDAHALHSLSASRVPHSHTARIHRSSKRSSRSSHQPTGDAQQARGLADDDSQHWRPLDPNKHYKLCTKAYLLLGKDGYDMFCDPSVRVIVDEEQGPILPTVVRNHFRMLAGLSGIGSAAGEVGGTSGNNNDGDAYKGSDESGESGAESVVGHVQQAHDNDSDSNAAHSSIASEHVVGKEAGASSSGLDQEAPLPSNCAPALSSPATNAAASKTSPGCVPLSRRFLPKVGTVRKIVSSVSIGGFESSTPGGHHRHHRHHQQHQHDRVSGLQEDGSDSGHDQHRPSHGSRVAFADDADCNRGSQRTSGTPPKFDLQDGNDDGGASAATASLAAANGAVAALRGGDTDGIAALQLMGSPLQPSRPDLPALASPSTILLSQLAALGIREDGQDHDGHTPHEHAQTALLSAGLASMHQSMALLALAVGSNAAVRISSGGQVTQVPSVPINRAESIGLSMDAAGDDLTAAASSSRSGAAGAGEGGVCSSSSSSGYDAVPSAQAAGGNNSGSSSGILFSSDSDTGAHSALPMVSSDGGNCDNDSSITTSASPFAFDIGSPLTGAGPSAAAFSVVSPSASPSSHGHNHRHHPNHGDHLLANPRQAWSVAKAHWRRTVSRSSLASMAGHDTSHSVHSRSVQLHSRSYHDGIADGTGYSSSRRHGVDSDDSEAAAHGLPIATPTKPNTSHAANSEISTAPAPRDSEADPAGAHMPASRSSSKLPGDHSRSSVGRHDHHQHEQKLRLAFALAIAPVVDGRITCLHPLV